MPRHLIAWTLAALALLPAAAGAQQHAPTLEHGDTVRVLAPTVHPRAIVGEVLSYYPDSLAVREFASGTRYAFALPTIRQLARNEGLNRGRSAWHGARFGIFLGTAVGLVAGPLIASRDTEGGNIEGTTALTGLGGGLLGGSLGGAAGALFARDHWQHYRMPSARARLSAAPKDGGMAVALTIPAP